MTITQNAPRTSASDDAEALFPEARRRRRRIRLSVGFILCAVAVSAAALVVGLGGGSAPPRAMSRGPITPGPNQLSADTIARATSAAGDAHELWRYVDSYPGCNPVQVGTGVLDLASQRSAVTVSESGCLPGGGNPADSQYRIVQIGSSLYRTRKPHEVGDFPGGKTWLLTSTNGDGEPWLASADPLRVLTAVSGPFGRVGTAYIRGIPTTEYRGTATLASMQAATATADSGPFGTADPPLTQIPIDVHVWIDAQGRVRQITTWETLYTQNYTDGYSQGGSYITPWPPHKPAGPPRRQGYDKTVLDLWQYGGPVRITRPPGGATTPR